MITIPPVVRRGVLWATSAIGAFVGIWATFLPREFYDAFPGLGFGPWVGVDGPFNEHLIRDVGALYLALAAAGVYAAVTGGLGASRAVGIAWLVFSLPHLGYHLHHLEGFTPLDAVGQVVSLSSTLVLAVPMLLPTTAERRAARPTHSPTTITKENTP